MLTFFPLMGCMQLAISQHTASDSLEAPTPPQQYFSFSTVSNEWEVSLQPFYNALKTADKGTQRFSIFAQLGAHHMERGNTDSILTYGNSYLEEVVNWQRPEEDKNLFYAQAYYLLGVGSQLNGLLDNGLKWHIKGIDHAERIQDQEQQLKHTTGLAHIYNLKREYSKAIPLLEKVLKDNDAAPLAQQIEAMIHLGDAHFGTKGYILAKKQYERALVLSKKIAALQPELNIRLKLGRIAESENRFDEAYKLYDAAKESALENGFNTLYFEGTILMGKLLYREKHYESAIIALSVAYINAIQRDNLNYQQQILDVQAKTFAATEDYKNAYAIMTQLAWVESEINARQQQKIIKELEVEYETLKKEKEILGLQEAQILKDTELKRQRTIRNAFLIGFLIILVPILGLLYVYYQKIQTQSELSKKQEEINVQKVASLVREQEMKVIKASLEGQDEERKRIAQELHDSIGGNLAGIKLQLSSLDDGSGSLKTVSRQLDETYQLVRDISHTLIPKKFRQHRFTEIVAEYLNAISGTGVVQIHFHPHPPEKINVLGEEVQSELFKIIQELTTNTLKHAEATKLEIHLNGYKGSTNLLFEDNGRGFDADQNAAGIGLKNLKERVTELQGTLHIDTKIGRGTVISIEIPTKEKKHEI